MNEESGAAKPRSSSAFNASKERSPRSSSSRSSKFMRKLYSPPDLSRSGGIAGREGSGSDMLVASFRSLQLQLGGCSMGGSGFNRVLEIRDAVVALGGGAGFFEGFEESLELNIEKRRYFENIERDLSVLSGDDFQFLKGKVIYAFNKKDTERGWSPAINLLNEAKAYDYLLKSGCVDVSFIPESQSSTPDISATCESRAVLCEVKTVNISKEELSARNCTCVTTVAAHLSSNFLEGKLLNIAKNAYKQINKYSRNNEIGSDNRLFIVMNFDHSVHEYIRNYMEDIKMACESFDFRAENGEFMFHEIAFHTHSLFYSADEAPNGYVIYSWFPPSREWKLRA